MKLLICLGAGLLLGAASCRVQKDGAGKKGSGQQPVAEKPHNTAMLLVQENTTAGKSISLSSDMKVIEPNSTLSITIDTSVLQFQLAGTTLGADITGKLKRLDTMMQYQQEAMQDVAQALLINTKDPKNPNWRPYMSRLNGFVKLIRDNPETRAIFIKSLPNISTISQRYQALFSTAATYIKQLQAQVTQAAKANGIYLQLGAWLTTKSGETPIHIPGYDDYTSQPSSVVEQFQYTLTAEQQQELTAISSLATEANQKGLGTALKNAVSSNGGLLNVLETLPSYKTAIKIEDTLEKIAGTGKAALAGLDSAATNAYQSIESYISSLDSAVKTFSTVSPGTTSNQLLLSVNGNINALVTKTTALKTSLTGDVNAIAAVAKTADNTAMSYVRNLSGQLGSLADSLQNDLSHLKTNMNDMFNTAISGQDLADGAYDFTSQVAQLSIGVALRPAVINLEVAGGRDEGDMVTIRMATGKPGQPIVEQALLQYHLYFCSLYARTATGFLFVNPVPLFKNSDGKALFRYSPSYSILLKGFWKDALSSRTDLSYHSLFNPGVGVNFSALTFNPNGTTELGVGGVFTLFNDFFQAGYGFDTVSGRGYMFFGFKIPVGSFSFQ